MAKKNKKPAGLKLSKYDADYVLDRREALMAMVGNRNAQMDRFEDLYHMRWWSEPSKDGDIRMNSPIAFDVVEKITALMATRPFTISVPPTVDKPEERNNAQVQEQFLYGLNHLTRTRQLVLDMTRNGLKLGKGYIKSVYNPRSADLEDEPQFIRTCPAPKAVYWRKDPTRRIVELVETYERKRNDIEAEWDKKLPRPDSALKDDDTENEWLNEEVPYTEYWCEEIVEEWVPAETDDAPPKIKGAMELASEAVLRQSNLLPAPPSPMPMPPMPADPMATDPMAAPEPDDNAAPGYELEDETAGTDKAEDKAEAKGKLRKVRKIVHAVCVGDDAEDDSQDGSTTGAYMVKPARCMVGYKRIPFYDISGVRFAPSHEAPSHDGLSILYALSGGDASTEGAGQELGVMQARNLLFSLMLEEAYRTVRKSYVTDDDKADINTGPDEVTVLKPGRQFKPLNEQMSNPAGDQMMQYLSQLENRVATPEVLNGSMMNISGQAITGFASAFEMLIGARQEEIETALAEMHQHDLWLAREYADPVDGWEVYGADPYGKPLHAKLTKKNIGARIWVQIKLSSSMPKDAINMVTLIAQLVGQDFISRQTGLDMVQQYLGVGINTPKEELQRILEEKYALGSEVTSVLSRMLGEMFTKSMNNGQPLPPPTPPPAPPQPPQGGGNVPMAPGMVSPQMVAASGNMGGAMAMGTQGNQ